MQPLTIRVARPTDDLEALRKFYCDGLGMDLLYAFSGHDGFDGIMVGQPGVPYHFEFTKKIEHAVGRAPTEENLIVFFLPDQAEWNTSVARMVASGFSPVPSFNPYWERNGKTFEDPDGYRVVLQNAAWQD